MEMAHPSPARRAALARPGEMCPLAPTAAESLAALLRDIQATIPDETSTGFAAALNAAFTRILNLLMAVLARCATAQPPVMAPPPAPHPATPSPTPHTQAISRLSRARSARLRHAAATPIKPPRRVAPSAPRRPRPVCGRAVSGRAVIATCPKRIRAASSRAPPGRHRENALRGNEHPHNYIIAITI